MIGKRDKQTLVGECHTVILFNHVGRFHDPKIFQIFSMDSLNELGIFVHYFIHSS